MYDVYLMNVLGGECTILTDNFAFAKCGVLIGTPCAPLYAYASVICTISEDHLCRK